jgi:predicted nuclease with RNAse H fold
MQPQYLGIDVAGANKTWMCVLIPSDGKPFLVQQPSSESLERIIQYAEQHSVVAAAIDAQLTWAASEERGFRSSDEELRRLLPPDCRNWVASQNSLMAVPVRGRQLAECLSPTVGTIIETHPRACLFFANKSLLESVKLYKQANGQEHAKKLWQAWISRFDIDATLPVHDDVTHDALDSLVCATLGYLFHYSPQQLRRMSHSATNKRDRGPFLVLQPVYEFECAERNGS